ncbi:uncharacterized protein K441DRAFT_253830 [Cenococcum geophilum 1.58]|uniref:uncharacterized protein n=1 Tax=Cenococcum geophilum 1.58 TaxID=794803 RepID=UPI00358E3997|nr:hypothetical protein K441DRAFT_253830 [Cenococcum geophilum 1.58]
MRLVYGPLWDRFGPRLVFVSCLFAGAIPTALAGTIHDSKGLIVLRFFIGILGTSFVPCQVWSTGFFDKNVVGTANALTGGWGNAGGGVTYFVMSATFDSLVSSSGLKPCVAWRVAFVVLFILITSIGVGMLLFSKDTPTGKWADRAVAVEQNLKPQKSRIVSAQGGVLDKPSSTSSLLDNEKEKREVNEIEVGP